VKELCTRRLATKLDLMGAGHARTEAGVLNGPHQVFLHKIFMWPAAKAPCLHGPLLS
jgi:hypothetical protein